LVGRVLTPLELGYPRVAKLAREFAIDGKAMAVGDNRRPFGRTDRFARI
jgi:hypothetical protein